jgi:DNA-directed RNA polymerase subunit F
VLEHAQSTPLIAYIVTLCPGDPEEAKVLIPSLVNKLSDDVLKDVLEQIDQQRQFNED